MEDLPNGFTGYGRSGSSFESAADAMRKSRQAQQAGRVERSTAASNGASSYARRFVQDGPSNVDAPFDLERLDEIPEVERRWAWMEIDKSAIRHNIAVVRRRLKPNCRLMAVVKGDAFGLGAVEVSKTLLGGGADRLAVSTVSEAVELRKAGITAPILVLAQPPAASIPLLLGYHVTPAIYEPDFAIAYAESADRHGMTAPYHLAVNTGMNRIGVRFDDVIEFLRQVSFHRALDLEGTYTHFATADLPEVLELRIQEKRFNEALGAMSAAGIDPGVVHAANSAALLRYPETQYDMARVGSLWYGSYPCGETRSLVELKPAVSVRARIVDTRLVPMSEGVSYGLRYRSPGSVKICTLPIGYGDGLQRALSNNTDFIMGGRYYRQVGAICMDHCMFEVDMRTYATRERVDPQVGDEVIIIGSQGIAEVTIEEMADKLNTLVRELIIGFGRRLPHVYV